MPSVSHWGCQTHFNRAMWNPDPLRSRTGVSRQKLLTIKEAEIITPKYSFHRNEDHSLCIWLLSSSVKIAIHLQRKLFDSTALNKT